MNSYRSVLVSKIKFFEKMARKTRRGALRDWRSGSAKFGTYEASLTVADKYDDNVMKLSQALKKYDEEKGLELRENTN